MAEEKKQDSDSATNTSIQKIAKGTLIVLIGSLVGILFTFIGRVLIIRFWSQSDYGVFSLALAILLIFSLIGSLGLGQGIIRNIAYSRGKKEGKKILDFISASIFFSIVASILLGFFLFFISKFIALRLFNEPGLIAPLKIFAIALPILNVINIVASIFRGFDQVKPMVYFKQVLIHALFPVFIVIIVFFNLAFIYVFYGYLASIVISCILLIIYALKRISTSKIFSLKSIASSPAKELILFSLPLLGSTILVDIIIWADTFMLGSLKSSADVGLYAAANPLARFISFPIIAFSVIFISIVSGLYAKGKMDEIKRNFVILTKWICLPTLPVFFLLFLYPDEIITFLYGSSYLPAATALRILSIGYIIKNFTGLHQSLLVAANKTRFIFSSLLVVAILNIVLNFALIPRFGIVGAAIASAISIFAANLIKSLKLYSITGVQPLSKNLIKPTLLSTVVILLIYFILQNFLTVNIWMIAIIFVSYYVIFGLATLLTRSLDKEDLDMLQAIERKTGIKSKLIKRIMVKFL